MIQCSKCPKEVQAASPTVGMSQRAASREKPPKERECCGAGRMVGWLFAKVAFEKPEDGAR